MKREKELAMMVNILVIVLVLIGVGIASLVLPKPSYSQHERRELASMPEFSVEALLSGSYTRNLDAHYADTFPQRESLVKLGGYLEEFRGLRLDDVRIHGTVPGQDDPEESSSSSESVSQSQTGDSSGGAGETSGSGLSSSSSEPYVAPPTVDDGAVGETVNSIFVYKGMALQLFGGNQREAQRYAGVINRYQELLGDRATIYNMVIPSHIEFVLPERYKKLTAPERPNIDLIYSTLNEGIKRVDAYSAIGRHMEEYLYFNTDHHWTGKGAYYAYTAFAEQAGFDPLPYDSYEKGRIDNFLGTLYSKTQDVKVGQNPDYVEYCKIPVEHTAWRYEKNAAFTPVKTSVLAEYATGVNSYGVYFAGDQPLFHIKTGNANGRKILVIKESYGNAFAPYLIPHYEEVLVADERYCQRNILKVIEEFGINEVCFVNNIFAANTAYHINNLEKLLTQPDPNYSLPPSSSSSSSSSSESGTQAEPNPQNEGDAEE